MDDLDATTEPHVAAVAQNRDATEIGALAIALQHVDAGHREMRRRFAGELGLSATEFRAFMQVGRAVELTPKHLADQLEMTTGAVTAMIDRLEAAGLMVRSPNPRDRRSLLLHLSINGVTVLAWMQDSYVETVADAARAWAGTSAGDVAATLEHLSTAILEAAGAVGKSPLAD